MNRYERNLWKQRFIVILHGICGAIIGLGTYMLLLVICMVLDLVNLESEIGYYMFFVGLPVIFVIAGIILTTKNDLYIFSRRF